MVWILVLLPVAYLLGTFPSAQLVARAYGLDVTAAGSGNPGASNVTRIAGWRAGAIVLVLDMAKGAIAAGVGYLVGGRPGAFALGAAAVLGHVLPVTRRFKGGKGVATAAGALLVLYPEIWLILAVVWIVVARVMKKSSVASLVICVLFPILAVVFGYATWEVVGLAVLALLVIARHASNLRRLLRGEEHSLRGGTVPEPPTEE